MKAAQTADNQDTDTHASPLLRQLQLLHYLCLLQVCSAVRVIFADEAATAVQSTRMTLTYDLRARFDSDD